MFKNIALIATLMAALMVGCGDKTEGDAGGDDKTSSNTTENVTKVAYYCGQCGHEAEAGHACDADCEKCDCGLHKGSDLCCKVPEELKGKDICSCGYAKGSENCCKEGAEECTKCHMIKGSDMCCKIPHEHDHAH